MQRPASTRASASGVVSEREAHWRPLAGLFAGDLLAFLEYLGEQPNPGEEIVSSLPEPRLYATGAVSQRQLKTCQTHVSANHVRSIDTPASRFAQGDSTAECGAGSGPFCQRVLDYRYLQEQQPPPGWT